MPHRHHAAVSLCCLLCTTLLLTHQAACSTPLETLSGVTSVKALTQVMYRDMQGYGGAYKLLNANGSIGSHGPDNPLDHLDAPLVHYSSLVGQQPPTGAVVVLLPVKQSADFVQHWLADTLLQQHVQGVLVDDSDAPSSYTTLGPFPWSEYAPYSAPDYVWNPAAAAAAGGGSQLALALSAFPAPVFLLTQDMAADAGQRATFNSQNAPPSQPQYHARLQLTMTAHAATNSSACIPAGNCKPVGGYSVWSALPPLVPLSPKQSHQQPVGGASSLAGAGGSLSAADSRPIILVVAQMDSIDMFHDAVQGANAPLSGLIAMLAALHALRGPDAAAVASSSTAFTSPPPPPSSTWSHRVVFLALAGEPWSYMGSRRLLFEAESGSNATAGLDLSLVEKVIEVGQVGRLQPQRSADTTTQQQPQQQVLYVHSQPGPGFGNASEVVSALAAAAQQEAAVAQVVVKPASGSNPGIPPSSLMSFLRVKPSLQGAVLAEFDTAFRNPFYASRFDNGSTIDAGSIASAAAVLAAAVHRLAGGDSQLPLQVNMTKLQQLVADHISCLVLPDPGFACPLASSLMTADYMYSKANGSRSYAPKNYVGVLQYMPDVQSPEGKSNLAKYLWNVMALDTAAAAAAGQNSINQQQQPGAAACDPFTKPCAEGQVCARWRGSSDKQLGTCVNATVRYVPSYSTQLVCQSCDDPWAATWQLSDAADAWSQRYSWPPDPVWVESDWPPTGTPDVQLYLHESPEVENVLLASGLLVTAAVVAVSYAARVAFARHQLAWHQHRVGVTS